MSLLSPLLDIFFPKSCVECGRFGTYICQNCYKTISFYSTPLCPGCMRAITPLGVHSRCRSKTPLDGLYAVAAHQGVIQSLISSIKYRGTFDMANIVGEMMVWHCKREKVLDSFNSKKCLIVPVPMYWKKEWERGFNQSERIARCFSTFINIPYSPKLLKKTNKTLTQTKLDRKQRLVNVQHSITFPHQFSLSSVSTVLIMDDVVTTGATLLECAKVLKTAGAKRVIGIVFAHGK